MTVHSAVLGEGRTAAGSTQVMLTVPASHRYVVRSVAIKPTTTGVLYYGIRRGSGGTTRRVWALTGTQDVPERLDLWHVADAGDQLVMVQVSAQQSDFWISGYDLDL